MPLPKAFSGSGHATPQGHLAALFDSSQQWGGSLTVIHMEASLVFTNFNKLAVQYHLHMIVGSLKGPLAPPSGAPEGGSPSPTREPLVGGAL